MSLIVLLILVVFTAVVGCTSSAEPAQMANPAAAFCSENNGEYEIREHDDGGQYGVCVFEDGSECDAWAYFRGECEPGQ